MIIENLSSLLLQDTLRKALELQLEDEFIYLLKKEITKRENEEKPSYKNSIHG
ncbi:Sporulation inhibitor A [Halobacillus dabanensis]|uniref:Sporulation inhibitor A n=1 Tax=Halobacillus dabanensis TaxID=240302 RepID=A0A1I3ZAX5_HALDA|nr:sporulation histidine kinase inhibitor Sda [Halobacillus dabanensis]SFK40796.1 Sporulation inhibitor A [Halobacillus dabanensis]